MEPKEEPTTNCDVKPTVKQESYVLKEIDLISSEDECEKSPIKEEKREDSDDERWDFIWKLN